MNQETQKTPLLLNEETDNTLKLGTWIVETLHHVRKLHESKERQYIIYDK